jgi:uncharacterized membrane protein
MTLFPFSLLVVSLVAFVVGQILLKVGMDAGGTSIFRSILWIGTGTGALTIYFFLTLGLLQQYDLSYLFPFQGVTVILIIAASFFILKEKLTLRLTIGALLITLGVVLVSTS